VYFCRWVSLALLLAAGFTQAALGSPQEPGVVPAPAPKTASPPVPALKTLPKADSQRVVELNRAIAALWGDGKFAEAIEPARQAVAICHKALGDGHWQTADWRRYVETLRTIPALPAEGRRALASVPALDAAGQVAYAKAHYEEAANLRLRAVEILRRWLGERHPDTATSYKNLAHVLHDRGDLAGAEAMFRKALAIDLEVLGERHPDTAASYRYLASVLYARGDRSGAEAMLRKALAIELSTQGERHPNTAASYNDLAVVLHARGDLPGAEAMHRKALAIYLDLVGERHPHTATCYTNLAGVLEDRGDLPGAEAMFRKGLAILIERLGERQPDTANSYNNLAGVLQGRGDLPGAEAMRRKALAIYVDLVGERHPHTATCYTNLAGVLRDRGDLPGAEAMHRKGLAIRIERLGERHPDTANSYSNLAGVLRARGDLAGAEAMIRKALEIWIERLPRHPDTAKNYNYLALVLYGRGDLAGADAMLRKALAIGIQTLGEHHPDTINNYAWQGLVLAGLGRSAEAIEALEHAGGASTEARKRTRGLEDAAAQRADPFPVLATLLARAGRTGDAWNRWERGLSRALLDEVAGRAGRPLTDDESQREAALQNQAQALDERFNRLLARGKPTPEVEKHLDTMRSEGNEVRRRLLEMQEQFELRYGPLAGQPATLEGARAALDDATALVGWVDADRYHWACVVRRSGDPIWVEIPGSGKDGAWTRDDETLADRLRAALASRSADDWRALAPELARQRLAPLEPPLKGVKRVIVVNSLGLAGLPVEVLFAARAQVGSPLPIVSYAPSATMFAFLAAKKPAQPRPETLLAVADPAYPERKPEEALPAPPESGLLVVAVDPKGNAGSRGVRSGDVLLAYDGAPLKTQADLKLVHGDGLAGRVPVRLWRDGKEQTFEVAAGALDIAFDPRPAAEVVLAQRAADKVLRGTRAGTLARVPGTRREVKAVAGLFPDGGATTIVGDQARESVVQEMARSGKLKGFRYLHFATHGRDDWASAYHTALLLAPDPDRSADPLAVNTDGEITAEEIARTWNLDADLVVLSACESGLGRYAGGEGFLGFAQPLLAKGARSLVLSLWRVDDKATSLLMARFYQNLLGKRPELSHPLPKTEALHEAKEWLRNLTQDEVGDELAALDRGDVRPLAKLSVPAETKAAPSSRPAGVRPFAHPYYWAAFILVGDPG
jgi:tetratricopeptide (TPR) repeat protein